MAAFLVYTIKNFKASLTNNVVTFEQPALVNWDFYILSIDKIQEFSINWDIFFFYIIVHILFFR